MKVSMTAFCASCTLTEMNSKSFSTKKVYPQNGAVQKLPTLIFCKWTPQPHSRALCFCVCGYARVGFPNNETADAVLSCTAPLLRQKCQECNMQLLWWRRRWQYVVNKQMHAFCTRFKQTTSTIRLCGCVSLSSLEFSA